MGAEDRKTFSPGRTLDVCLVAHFAYGALLGGRSGHIGGVERQTSMLAKWLAARGHRVSLLTWDEGQPDGSEIDGVRVFTICRRQGGLPGLRFLHPRWTGLVRAMGRADAQVYYQNCGEAVTGQVALWCRLHGRRFVYSVAADPDCDAALPLMTLRERILYRIGLRQANIVIVQTEKQREMLRSGFHLPSIVFPMPCPGPAVHEFVPPRPPDPGQGRVVWLGRLVFQKRPDRLVEIALRCPDMQFDLVGPDFEEPELQHVIEQASRIPNLIVHGSVSRERVDEFYRRAHCLCSTSDYEGFPNTYLEAWSHGLPVVALADPDGIIRTRTLGVAAADVDGLVAGIRRLFDDRRLWLEASANARAYYLGRHTVDSVMAQFEDVFLRESMEHPLPVVGASRS